MRERVYIETTIPSFYHNNRDGVEMLAIANWTKLWWDKYRYDYDLVTSLSVLEELEAGEHPFKAEKLKLLADVEVLPKTEQVERAAIEYVRTLTMPADPVNDAYHLAFASVHSCQILLTWNCSHLANRRKVRQIAEMNRRLGLTAPAIITPRDLIGEQGDEYGSNYS